MRSSTRVKRPDRAKKGALAELQAARRKKTQRSGCPLPSHVLPLICLHPGPITT